MRRRGTREGRSKAGAAGFVCSTLFWCGLLLVGMATSIIMFMEIQPSQEILSYLDRLQVAESSVKLLNTKTTSNNDAVEPPTARNGPTGALPVGSNLTSNLVDCPALLESFRQGLYQDPNEGELIIGTANQSYAPKEFQVSLHRQEFDKYRWIIAKRGRYYERNLEEAWGDVLKDAPPHARVLDVGANIGYFSLYSGTWGSFHVDTFEPNPVNLLRTCQSLQQNGWSNEFSAAATDAPTINLWQCGIADVAGSFPFEITANPGAAHLTSRSVAQDEVTTDVPVINVLTLDDFARARGWLDENSNVRIEILKIDVEAFETFVLAGAKTFLEKIIVRNIFMEWSLAEDNREGQKRALELLLDAGYTLCGWGGYLGPKLGNIPFDVTDRGNFMNNFFGAPITLRNGAVNVWWQNDPTCPSGATKKK